MGGPEMAPHTPPFAPRSSQRLDRASGQPAPPVASRSSQRLDRSSDKPIPVVTAPHVHVSFAELSSLEADALVLTAEERRWGRRRVTTRGGRELQLALPTGSRLTPGEILHV